MKGYRIKARVLDVSLNGKQTKREVEIDTLGSTRIEELCEAARNTLEAGVEDESLGRIYSPQAVLVVWIERVQPTKEKKS